MNSLAHEIILRAKKDVFSGNLGDNLTTFIGDGLDFREIRDYSEGDDVRKINWSATAKGAGVKTNVFNDERELDIVLVFMLSGSLHFGSVKFKQEVAAEILALLGFSAIKNQNNLHGVLFSNKTNENFSSRKNNSIVYQLVDAAIEIDCLGKEFNYKKFCNFINKRKQQKSLIFMVGDFYGKVDLSEIAHKNEIHAIMVRDRIEENPLLNGEFDIVDPNSFSSGKINFSKKSIKKYIKYVADHDFKVHQHFLEHKISFGKIYTDDDIYTRLAEIIKG